MKKLIIGLLLLVGFNGWGQEDTLEYTTPREVADVVFGLLDAKLYGNALFDRSLSEDELLIQQLKGDYSGIGDAYSWLQAYSDIGVSYTDSKYMLHDTILIDKMSEVFIHYQRTNREGKIMQPFGLLLHQMSKIDSSLYQKDGAFSNHKNQLKLNSSIDEKMIYNKVLLKEGALLEFYGDHGYEEGIIVYNSDFISIGPGIDLHSIQLDVGNGFQEFSEKQNKVIYRIEKDRQIGKVVLDYTLDRRRKQDTLTFYLTSEIYKYKNQSENLEKSTIRWDEEEIVYPGRLNPDLEYAIKYGCGNNNKIRRPIIIAPPYSPALQDVSFKKYYDQFDFKSLFYSLSEMGYDVIFIKQTPGNRGINHSGNILADFLIHINLIKKYNYPNEDWENTVIGFSAGGQHWRWALKKLEKEHMEQGGPHHHTRLYIPYDSPHWGANVPMFTQAVFKELNATLNPLAYMVYHSLTDAASKDMLMNHIIGSQITHNDKDRIIVPHPTSERENIVYHLENSFNHQFTDTNDLRRSFPTFTRNVAVSVGGNTKDYTDEYSLNPGMKLFKQNIFFPKWWGAAIFDRHISSSQYNSASSVFYRYDLRVFFGLIPVQRHRHYKTKYAYEWDMAQGGYKNEFFDKRGLGFIPIDPVAILRLSGAYNLGTKLYNKKVLFLPMVSALAINPTIWQDNNLYYNLKDEGLMYNEFSDTLTQSKSDLYGYPNLGHPNTHFDITPFEAIYSDPQTYEHIKMQASVDESQSDNNISTLDDIYIVHTRNFILDEVEANIVYLQNKTIGKNHVQGDPNYRYKAWYKAIDQIVFSIDKTPKTDPGPFIIEETGEVVAYACNSISMYPGFHAQQGGMYHAYVHCDNCFRPSEQGKSLTDGGNEIDEENQNLDFHIESIRDEDTKVEKDKFKVFPNPSTNGFTIEFPEVEGEYIISNSNGNLIQQNSVRTKSNYLQLPKGIYFVKWINKNGIQTQKLIAL